MVMCYVDMVIFVVMMSGVSDLGWVEELCGNGFVVSVMRCMYWEMVDKLYVLKMRYY